MSGLQITNNRVDTAARKPSSGKKNNTKKKTPIQLHLKPTSVSLCCCFSFLIKVSIYNSIICDCAVVKQILFTFHFCIFIHYVFTALPQFSLFNFSPPSCIYTIHLPDPFPGHITTPSHQRYT